MTFSATQSARLMWRLPASPGHGLPYNKYAVCYFCFVLWFQNSMLGKAKEKRAFLLLFTRFFVTLPTSWRIYSVSATKTNEFVLCCSRLFVTLEEFAGFLCIKAVPRIEKKIGLRTGDRSPFYVLLQIAFNEHPTLSHQPSYDSMSGAKVRKNPRIHKQLTIFVLRTSGHFCVPAPVSICDTHT